MNETDLIAALAGTVVSGTLAYFAYRRGQRADNAAAENTATAQVYSGYGGLLERIQKDNVDLRERLAEAEKHLADCDARINGLLERVRIAEERG